MRRLRMRMMKSWGNLLRSRYVLWFRTVPCYTTSWAQPASFSDKASLRLNSYVHALTIAPFLDNAWCGHRTSVCQNSHQGIRLSFSVLSIFSQILLTSLSPHYFHNVPSSPILVSGGYCATSFAILSQCQVLHADL